MHLQCQLLVHPPEKHMAGCNFWGHEVDPIGLVLAKTLTLVGELNIIFCALVKPLLKSH